MMHMAATFEVEGPTGDSYFSNPVIGTARITLETDGMVVRIVPTFQGAITPLTPLGWKQLAEASAKLLTEANEAARRAGAVADEAARD